MSFPLQLADSFRHDFSLLALWYVREAGEEVARKFQKAVDSSVDLLSRQPEIGRIRNFTHPKLQGLRSFPVARPFQKILIFYRIEKDTLQLWRLMP